MSPSAVLLFQVAIVEELDATARIAEVMGYVDVARQCRKEARIIRGVIASTLRYFERDVDETEGAAKIEECTSDPV